jgi:hypothetical protein
MFAGTFTDYWQLRRALDTGSCAVAEGVVTHFIPAAQSRTHSQTESFSVGAQRFAYSDYVVTAGFHLTSKRGGPIRQGLHVRVHHRNGEIARLEIAE